MIQSNTEKHKAIQSNTKENKVIKSNTKQYKVMQSNTTLLQNSKELQMFASLLAKPPIL